ncbi:MAG: thioredoxin family protein [Deltaproteobacteria bacterium]|nr:thioredoxin family protein [Deltaproteobacteria bacterium]
MRRESLSHILPIGSTMPEFLLPSVSGKMVNSAELNGEAFLVLFMCNHCPYVVGSIRRVNETIRKWQPKGLVAIGINSNDPTKYPQDSFENMKDFAQNFELCFEYCFDESQDVARAFDAMCTPEAYLFDKNRKLVYHGGVVDNPMHRELVKVDYLDQVLSSYYSNNLSSLDTSNWKAEGCSIKWK